MSDPLNTKFSPPRQAAEFRPIEARFRDLTNRANPRSRFNTEMRFLQMQLRRGAFRVRGVPAGGMEPEIIRTVFWRDGSLKVSRGGNFKAVRKTEVYDRLEYITKSAPRGRPQGSKIDPRLLEFAQQNPDSTPTEVARMYLAVARADARRKKVPCERTIRDKVRNLKNSTTPTS